VCIVYVESRYIIHVQISQKTLEYSTRASKSLKPLIVRVQVHISANQLFVRPNASKRCMQLYSIYAPSSCVYKIVFWGGCVVVVRLRDEEGRGAREAVGGLGDVGVCGGGEGHEEEDEEEREDEGGGGGGGRGGLVSLEGRGGGEGEGRERVRVDGDGGGRVEPEAVEEVRGAEREGAEGGEEGNTTTLVSRDLFSTKLRVLFDKL
jgi:hypothetical protein